MDGGPDECCGKSKPRAKASLVLGGESFAVSFEPGTLSGQLAAMRRKSMVILMDYIAKHNVPNDVPDESVEGSEFFAVKSLSPLLQRSVNMLSPLASYSFDTESQIILRHYCIALAAFCNKSLCSQRYYLIICSCREVCTFFLYNSFVR